ncbi:MAG: RNA methyltransferase [Clostridiales bacterium]|nr:RNA methyltransferase [Clostridiales bacterium]
MPKIQVVQDLSAPELDVYARLTERQLLHYYEPNGGLFIAESPYVIERAMEKGHRPISILLETKHLETKAKDLFRYLEEDPRWADLPVYTGEREVLQELTGYAMTRGVLCAMERLPLPDPEEILSDPKVQRVVILEDVMNPTNIGAIFRSAAALGMDAVLLTPGCSDPLYRRSARVSMGTVFQIPWTFLGGIPEDWPDKGMETLRRHGFRTAAMALKDDTISIDDPVLAAEDRLAIILGTEGDGLKDSTIADCDYTVKIPMMHGVDSLNVAAASAVAFWALKKA